MYYKINVNGAVRVDPSRLYVVKLKDAIHGQLKEDFEGTIDVDVGRVLKIISINNIGDGIIIPGDGAAYYQTDFTVLTYLPETQELIEGTVKDIASFGAFIDFGPFEGMVHISQTMEDYVSLDEKNRTLTGKESKKLLKVGDAVRARIIAVSYKDPDNPKIGLTMRQPCLGKLDWIEDARKDGKKAKVAAAKKQKASTKSKGKKEVKKK